MTSKKDYSQVLKDSHDEVNNSLRMTMTGTTSEIELSAADGDSVRSFTALEPVGFDTILYSYPNATTTVLTYRTLGVTVGTVTQVFTDGTKTAFSSIVRT